MKRIILIIVLFICSMGISQANGLFQNNSKSAGGFWKNSNSTTPESSPTGPLAQNAPGLPGDNPGSDSPVGEGIWFLLACAGGYALKRSAQYRVKTKK